MAADPVQNTAQQLFGQKKFQETIWYCDSILKGNAHSIVAWSFRASANRWLGKEKEAIHDYTRVLELDNCCVCAYQGRAKAYRALGEYHQSLQDYEAVLRLDPFQQIWALAGRAAVYRRQQRFSEAMKSANAALAIDESTEKKSGNTARVTEDCRELAYSVRGLIYLQQGNFEAADRDLTQSLQIMATAYIYEQRAAVRRHLNRDRDAIQDCLSALTLDSTLVFAKELHADLKANLDLGIPKAFIYNALAPAAQHYVAPTFQFWKPTVENPAPTAPPAEANRPLFM